MESPRHAFTAGDHPAAGRRDAAQPDGAVKPRDADAWFRQPIVWLGTAVLYASIVGCIVTIVLATRHADTPVATGSDSVLKVPLRNAATDEKR